MRKLAARSHNFRTINQGTIPSLFQMTQLRPLVGDDFELISTWENIPELWRVSEQIGPFSEDEISSFMNRCLDETNTEIERWIIVANDEPVGAVDLFDYDWLNKSCGIGIFITDPINRCKGHAARGLEQALDILKERRCRIVRAMIYTDNHASIRLFEKLKFKRGGQSLFKGRTVFHYFREIIP